MRFLHYFSLILLLYNSVVAQDHPAPQEYLRGWITPDSLYRAAPIFQPVPGAYQPEEKALRLLRLYDEPLTVLIFFGDWCSDSKREMPKFYALLDFVNNKNFTAKLFGLDRSKRDDGGLAEAFNITHVPTFIFLRGTRNFSANNLREITAGELGRIIETPAISIEQDWLNILKRNSEWSSQLELERQISLLLISIAFVTIY